MSHMMSNDWIQQNLKVKCHAPLPANMDKHHAVLGPTTTLLLLNGYDSDNDNDKQFYYSDLSVHIT